MMRVRCYGLIILTLSIFAALPAKAERYVRAVYFRSPDGAPSEVYVSGIKGNPRLELPRMNFSAPMGITNEGVRIWFTPNAIPDGDEIPAGAPFADLPESWEQAVLLFFPDPTNKVLPVKVLAVDASPGVFGLGDRYWLNLSRTLVVPQIGDIEVPQIKPGTSYLMRSPKRAAGDMPVIVRCMLPDDPRWRDLCRTTWRHEPNTRKLVFILPNPGRRVPRIWSVPFSDTPPTEDE